MSVVPSTVKPVRLDEGVNATVPPDCVRPDWKIAFPVVVAPPEIVRPPACVPLPMVEEAVISTGDEVETALFAYTQNGSAVR